MPRWLWLIGLGVVLLTSASARAQRKVVLTADQQQRLGLVPSSYYIIYTREEYLQLKHYDDLQQQLVDKLKFEIKFQQETIADLKLSQQILQQDLKYWRDYSKMMFGVWEKCDLRMRRAEAGSWWPWVVTAAALTGSLIASGFAIYYHHELNR